MYGIYAIYPKLMKKYNNISRVLAEKWDAGL